MSDRHATALKPVEPVEQAEGELADDELDVVSGGFLASEVLSVIRPGCWEDGPAQNCMFT